MVANKAPVLKGRLRTRQRVEGIAQWIWEIYSYQFDQETYGKPDYWHGALDQFLGTGRVKDDCDGFSRFVLAVLRFCGGFASSQLAELVTDVGETTQGGYDHHVCAVRVNGEWLYLHCWGPDVLTFNQITYGGYDLPNGRAAGMKIHSFRTLDKGNDGWVTGHPHE